jgi:hypothetical protein
LGLTQKAIAYERAIASWSTVNKFFNGKPVDRFIFQEICDVLELDWQTVWENGGGRTGDGKGRTEPASTSLSPQPPPSTPLLLRSRYANRTGISPDSSLLYEAVQTQAAAAREALTPRILERISREVVRERYLKAIARGVDGQQRLISIIGPAGYGKSTILGDLYDELIAANTPWVGVILCSSLSLSTGYLGFMSQGFVAATFAPMAATGMGSGPSQSQQDLVAHALGQSLCGEHRSVVALTSALNQTQGRGVLLIDTLDLVVNRDFVRVFGSLMRQVLAGGTTVVFTCRDYEYSDYLEPTAQRLPGLTQAVESYPVPNFTTAEIRAAAIAFFHKLDPGAPERGKTFADNILALSTDNRSLRDILENPLLLALLCDLFGQDGHVPPDLTVSKLYQRYWREKVTYSRVDQSHFAPLAVEKESLCLTIAAHLLGQSQTRLQESFYRDELEGGRNPSTIAAYNDLLSEGVLTPLASGKVHFFHQTLLEYAIAYWLTRQSAMAERQRFFQQIQQPQHRGEGTHWLPVLRQFLAIVEEAEFQTWLGQLDLDNMGVFGAVAYAAISRERPDALRQLLPIALQMGETHQQRLRQALGAAPRQTIETIWDVVSTLLAEAEHVTASNTVQMVGDLFAQWWRSLRGRLPDAVQAIAARSLQPHERFPQGYDDRPQLLGWLLRPCWPLLQGQPEATILQALQQQVPLLGHGSCTQLIYCHEGTDPALQHALLRRFLQAPVPRYEDIKTALVQWIAALLPEHLALVDCPLGSTWQAVLYTPRPEGWSVVLSLAVAHWAGRDRTLFEAIVEDGLFGPVDRLGANLLVLRESVGLGAGGWLAPYLCGLPPMRAQGMAVEFLARGLSAAAVQHIPPADQEAIAQWLEPYAADQAVKVWTLFNNLADAAVTAQAVLPSLMPHLPPQIRRQVEIQLLRFQPIASHPPIATLSKPDQRFLLALYQDWAQQDPVALQRLVTTALGKQNDAAVTASRGLGELGGVHLSAEQLLPLLRSPFVGVRVNGLTAMAALSEQQPMAASVLTQVAIVLADETNPTVGRLYCDLVAAWVHRQQRVLPEVLNTLTAMIQRLIRARALEGGMGRSRPFHLTHRLNQGRQIIKPAAPHQLSAILL